MKQRDATSSAPELSQELEALARRVGSAWVEEWRRELAVDGRPMSGGWPGTLSEARERAATRMRDELRSDDPATLEAVARKANEIARSLWLSQSERDEDDD
jgi:alkylhydroperoxidase family enzyme